MVTRDGESGKAGMPEHWQMHNGEGEGGSFDDGDDDDDDDDDLTPLPRSRYA